MTLSKWHSSRFEPAVENFRNSLKLPFTLFRRNSNLINEFSVNISDTFDAW